MCGICGFVGDGNKEVLLQMRKKIIHRGPDDAGIYFQQKDRIGLGHRRLSIIDLTHLGRQPMQSSSGRTIIAYNGEVYNYLEIKNELIKYGIRFSSNTDTEVVLEALEYWGVDAINKFNGMFAIAIWDKYKKELMLIRDRMGIKPLYYAFTISSEIVFSSEIKSILEYPNISKTIDYNSLDSFLKIDYIPGEKTIFKSINKLKPAHYLSFIKGDVKVRRYWSLNINKKKKSINHWLDELEDQILVSVKARMNADVPIGLFLSGGIDSTIILTAMSRLSKEPVKAFTIGFPDDRYDEFQYAKFVAEKNHAKLHYKLIDTRVDLKLIKQIIYQSDEPIADGSLIPTYLASKYGREHVKVILSGDGGDETFLGYKKYDRFINYELNHNPFKVSNFSIINALIRKSPVLKRSLMLRYLQEPSHRYAEITYGYFSKSFSDIYGNAIDYESITKDRNLASWLVHSDSKTRPSLLTTAQLIDYQSYLPDDILMKVDKMSMLNSLEVRVPLLDHNIQELAAAQPDNLKLFKGTSKFILKKLLERWGYPVDFIYREKKGFAPSTGIWFANKKNKEKIENEILYGSATKEKIFSRKHLNRRIHKNDYNTIWRVWIFEKWYSQYFN